MRQIRLVVIMMFLLLFIFAESNQDLCLAGSKSIIYKNSRFKFTLEIPLSWKGNYIIKEDDPNYIEFCFVGKSKASKNILRGNQINGLSMFYIGTEKYIKENEYEDGVKKIGRSHQVNYYYFTNTDYPVSVLFDVYHSDIDDQNEKKQAYQDFQKVRQMEKDVDKILKSFKPIK